MRFQFILYICGVDLKLQKQTALFVEVYETYKEPFIKFANSFVRDYTVAENLFADAFMDYWVRRDTLPVDCNVAAYILTTLRHKSLNHLRDEIRHHKISDDMSQTLKKELEFRANSLENFTIQSLFTDEISSIVSDVLSKMPDQTRTVFELSRFSNKMNSEIAQIMGISVKAVEYHITKVLKVLRVSLQDYILVFIIFFLK